MKYLALLFLLLAGCLLPRGDDLYPDEPTDDDDSAEAA